MMRRPVKTVQPGCVIHLDHTIGLRVRRAFDPRALVRLWGRPFLTDHDVAEFAQWLEAGGWVDDEPILMWVLPTGQEDDRDVEYDDPDEEDDGQAVAGTVSGDDQPMRRNASHT